MASWTVTFQDAPEMVRIRANKARRQAHIRFVQAHPQLRIGGELAIDTDQGTTVRVRLKAARAR